MAVPQLQLANLGEIFAQNQARQANMDNVMLQQQAALEQRQAQQAAAQREAAIRQAIASGVDPSSREGLGQLLQAGLPLEQFQSGLKSIGDIELAKARGEAAQRTAGAAETRAKAAERTAIASERRVNAQVNRYLSQNRIDQARLDLDRQNTEREYGADLTETFINTSVNILGLPLKEQKDAYNAAKPLIEARAGEKLPEWENGGQDAVKGFAAMRKPQKQGTTVNINQGGGSYFKEIGKGFAQQDLTSIDVATKAADQIKTAQSVIDIVNQGKAITGTAADLRANIAKGFATIGLTSGESVAATEQLSSTLARQTMDSIKSSGLGAGQGFTNTDREFLEKAASGEVNFTPEGLVRIAELNKKAAEAAYQKGQEAINRINQNPEGASILGGYQLPELPTVTPPTPGTIKDGYRFKGGNPADANNWEPVQ